MHLSTPFYMQIYLSLLGSLFNLICCSHTLFLTFIALQIRFELLCQIKFRTVISLVSILRNVNKLGCFWGCLEHA
jgi:hypothetical protein